MTGQNGPLLLGWCNLCKTAACFFQPKTIYGVEKHHSVTAQYIGTDSTQVV